MLAHTIATSVKSKGPHLNFVNFNYGMDFRGRKYTSNPSLKTEGTVRISKEILNEINEITPWQLNRDSDLIGIEWFSSDELYHYSVKLSRNMKNKQIAWAHFFESAKRGSPLALYDLGKMIIDQYQIPHQKPGWTPDRGIRILEEAGRCGNVNAYLDLGALHLFGKCVEQNFDKAREYYEKSDALDRWELIEENILSSPNPGEEAKLYGKSIEDHPPGGFSRE